MPAQKTIVHVVTGIDVGGAEFMLLRTVEHANHDRFRHVIVSLKGRGDLSDQMNAAGAGLVHLDFRGPLHALRSFYHLCRLCHPDHAAVVQTWLAHATLFGSLACLVTGNRRLLWCIHTGNQAPSRVSRVVRTINRLLGPLSRIAPRLIVSVSNAASERAISLGFPRSKIRLIPNGTNTDAFRPDPTSGAELRESAGIPESSPVVGIIGRKTPEKDFATFFRAALQVCQALPDAHFLLCGKGLETSMAEAAQFLPSGPLRERFHFLGVRQDMARVYNACSIVVLTSVSEAFPLVLGEAMACGIPVAATDVGDCRILVGEAGIISPPRQVDAIAQSWISLLSLSASGRQALSGLARKRILDHYAMRPCIEQYETIYEDLSLCSVSAARPTARTKAAAAQPTT